MKHVVGPVHKDALLCRVTVHIKVVDSVYWHAILDHSLDHRFDCPWSRVQLLHCILKRPVEVSTNKRCSLVSNDHSVRVDHRYDLKDASVSQLSRNLARPNYEVDEAMGDPRRVSLARMHPRSQYHKLLRSLSLVLA